MNNLRWWLYCTSALLARVVVDQCHGYASWLPCYIEFDEDEVVMNNYIVPAEKASTLLNIQVRQQGTEEWTASSTDIVDVEAHTVYEARFHLADQVEGLEMMEFVLEVSEGGSFAADKSSHCNSMRARGKAGRIVNFTVDGTREKVTMAGAWALGHSAVSLTLATVLRSQVAGSEEQEL